MIVVLNELTVYPQTFQFTAVHAEVIQDTIKRNWVNHAGQRVAVTLPFTGVRAVPPSDMPDGASTAKSTLLCGLNRHREAVSRDDHSRADQYHGRAPLIDDSSGTDAELTLQLSLSVDANIRCSLTRTFSGSVGHTGRTLRTVRASTAGFNEVFVRCVAAALKTGAPLMLVLKVSQRGGQPHMNEATPTFGVGWHNWVTKAPGLLPRGDIGMPLKAVPVRGNKVFTPVRIATPNPKSMCFALR